MASFSPKEVLVLADSLYDEVAYPHYKYGAQNETYIED